MRAWLRGRSGRWELVCDRALAYRAPNGFGGVCHLRIFESSARRERPVVIVGQLSDRVIACSIVNADEWIAAQIQDTFFADGRRFVYVEHHPESITGSPPPDFAVLELERTRTSREPSSGEASREGSSAGRVVQSGVAVVSDEGAESHALPDAPAEAVWGWTFEAVRRKSLSISALDEDHVGLDLLPGVAVRVWPTDRYTAYAVAGEEGALPLVEAGDANSERAAELAGAIDAVTEARGDAIVDVWTDAPRDDLSDPED